MTRTDRLTDELIDKPITINPQKLIPAKNAVYASSSIGHFSSSRGEREEGEYEFDGLENYIEEVTETPQVRNPLAESAPYGHPCSTF